jgi:GTP 3',8-cyclase
MTARGCFEVRMRTLLGTIRGTPERRQDVVDRIRRRVEDRGGDLAREIRDRDLYFRVSVVGTCNLSCAFCHNEGAPAAGKMSLATAELAIAAAVRAGFTRVQFTGGEPLLRPDIADFVRMARSYVTDVGVTTNGTYLPQRLNALTEAGLHRLHVSLQTEPLEDAGTGGHWGIPAWLMPTVERAAADTFRLRLNLPVPAGALATAERFLRLLTAQGVDVKVFSVLPEGDLRAEVYPLAALRAVVNRVNAAQRSSSGRVLMRGFRAPSGLRCTTCADIDRCREQSHSLRLGADLVLRPCLATRAWDSTLVIDDLDASIRQAALLALDYQW